MPLRTWRNFHEFLMLACLTGAIVGCSSTQTSNTARTASEQMLISNAVDNSLDKIDFSSCNGHKVYFEEKYVDCVDKSYVIASVRHRIMKAGGRVVDKPDDAEVVLELRAGGVGTNTSESFIGVPEITLPGMLTLPEVRFAERKMQKGTAKFGLVAYDPKTRQVLGSGGTSLAQSDDSNWYVVGVGPFQTGTVRSEMSRGTSGAASVIRDRIPQIVAFSPPPPAAAPAAQYVEQPPAEIPQQIVAPASASLEPVWYQE